MNRILLALLLLIGTVMWGWGINFWFPYPHIVHGVYTGALSFLATLGLYSFLEDVGVI